MALPPTIHLLNRSSMFYFTVFYFSYFVHQDYKFLRGKA